MRIFVAIDIPSEIKQVIEIETDKILAKTVSHRKALSDTYHLTLKFIGEIEISDIVALDQLLGEALKDVKAFDVHLKDMGYFEKDNQYILWMGVHQGVGYLKEIHQKIDQKISELFHIERTAFTPHITLARKVVVDKISVLNKNKTKDLVFRAEEVVIFYSHRVEEVLTYTPLSKIKLQ